MRGMVLKGLNDVSIYIVPLLDDNITWSDLTVESGFINAYTTDKNRPFLEEKIFLIYDSSVNTKESMNRYKKFRQLDSLYNTKYITINNKHYMIYCFSKLKYKKDINNLQLVGKTSTIDAALEINRFWTNVPVPELAQRLFLNTYRFGESMNAELPEEDYYSYEECDELS
jgi:hypothetical protein